MSDTPEERSVPVYRVTSNPLPMPPEMFALLGEIVILWSRIETSMEHDTSVMMQWEIVRRGVKELPSGFSKRLKFWRRCVRRLYPKVEIYQAQADEFERVAGIVSKMRNHVIHGFWGLQPTDEGGFNVTSIRHQVDGAKVHKFEVTVDFLRALLNDMWQLDSYITSFIVTKMMHGHLGLLKAEREPSPQHPSPKSPPKPSKPRRPRRSSPR